MLVAWRRRAVPRVWGAAYSTHRSRRPIYKAPERTDCDSALESFDASYSGVYGAAWPGVRAALLSTKKHAAVLNNVCPAYDHTRAAFQNLGCIDVGERYMAERADFLERKSAEIYKNIKKMNSKNKKKKSDGDPLDSIPRFKMSDEEREALDQRPKPEQYPLRYKERREFLADSRPPTSERLLPPSPTLGDDVPELQDFVPPTSLKGAGATSLEEDSFLKFKQELESERGPHSRVEHPPSPPPWPHTLSVLAFPRAIVARFPKPSMASGVSDHFALDAGSLLPVLLLGVQDGDTVLDLCAAPGGKTLQILQSASVARLHSNDRSHTRVARIQSVVRQFYGRPLPHHRVTDCDALALSTEPCDRVLLDAPCSTDRHSLMEPSNNLFRRSRLKERLQLPEVQSNLLVAAVKQCKVGGTIVYSTCTLSPLQNDGVVHLALGKLWDHCGIECTVVNYSPVLKPLDFLLRLGGAELGLKYGHVVLPTLVNNYGPTYVAKLVRTK